MKKLLALFCLLCLPVFSDAPKIYLDNDNNLAVEGYDVVSYYNMGSPEMGIKPNETEWQGVRWRFTNAENMRKFEKNPEKYAPQFGGYCATAVASGRLAGGLPNIWEVFEDKLYFFCSHEAVQKWKENRWEMKKMAESNWPNVLKKSD